LLLFEALLRRFGASAPQAGAREVVVERGGGGRRNNYIIIIMHDDDCDGASWLLLLFAEQVNLATPYCRVEVRGSASERAKVRQSASQCVTARQNVSVIYSPVLSAEQKQFFPFK
jgi:hypothetical protein